MFIPVWGFSQQSLYDINLNDIHDNQISLNSFAGKKIVVLVVDATNPDEQQLKMLDTLCRDNINVMHAIAIPVSNFGKGKNNERLAAIFNKLNIAYTVSGISKAKKSDGEGQNKLLRWLTHAELNKHFDKDIEEPGQIFVISETGILYATMKKKILPTGSTMKKILGQHIKP